MAVNSWCAEVSWDRKPVSDDMYRDFVVVVAASGGIRYFDSELDPIVQEIQATEAEADP